MMGVYGNEIYRNWDNSTFAQFNYRIERLGRWHGEGTSNTMPRLSSASSSNWNRISTIYMEDGDYLKIKTIEYLDNRLVRLIYEEVCRWDEPVAIAVLPDHPTPCAVRTHTAEPVPFLIYKPGMTPDGVTRFDEFSVKEGKFGVLEKDEFIKEFLND